MQSKNICLVIGMLATASSTPVSSKLADPIHPHLKFVASVEGKSFFSDSAFLNRTEAMAFCASLGMTLASITSRDQWNVLDLAYNADSFNDLWSYWTAGQDSLSISQFRWVGNLTIDESFSKLDGMLGEPQTCIFYKSNPGAGTSSLRNYLCSERRPVLCQTN